MQVDSQRRQIAVPSSGRASEVRALLDELDPDRTAVARFAVHAATLDDVFLALTARPAAGAHTAEEEHLHV